MVDLSHLKELPHDIRCLALVGDFLQRWGNLESTLNYVMQTALQLSPLQGAVLSKNVQMRDKIHICKTVIDLYLYGEAVVIHKKALSDVSDFSLDRNMIAHDMFIPDPEGDGVEFYVIKAKGRFDIPKVAWSVADFEKRAEQTKRLWEYRIYLWP
jgi:hypothetical protein